MKKLMYEVQDLFHYVKNDEWTVLNSGSRILAIPPKEIAHEKRWANNISAFVPLKNHHAINWKPEDKLHACIDSSGSKRFFFSDSHISFRIRILRPIFWHENILKSTRTFHRFHKYPGNCTTAKKYCNRKNMFFFSFKCCTGNWFFTIITI
jgi:hypothetical protein